MLDTAGQGFLSAAVDPVDSGVIYIAKYGGHGVFKTTNGGVDWDQLFLPDSEVAKTVEYNFIDSVSMDPNDHKHLVVGTHATCAAPYGPTCEAESKDAGATWHIVKLPIKSWEEGAGPFVLNATSWLYGGTSGLWLTTDNGGTWKNVTPAGTGVYQGGEVENHSIFRNAKGTYYLTSLQGLISSPDGQTWSLENGCKDRRVGLAMGGGHLYMSDQWSNYYVQAADTDPMCSQLLPPAALPADQGAPYLAYDNEHHVLYSSNFGGGAWRIVTQ